jgi:hypothetical protein
MIIGSTRPERKAEDVAKNIEDPPFLLPYRKSEIRNLDSWQIGGLSTLLNERVSPLAMSDCRSGVIAS